MRFQNVIAVNPPSPPGYVSNKDSMSGFGQLFPAGSPLFPTLDLVYLVSYLAEQGLPVEVIDSPGLHLDRTTFAERLAEKARKETTLIVARTSAPTLDWDLDVLRDLRQQVPDAKIAVYGPVVPHVMKRLHAEDWLDYLIGAEPDQTVEALVAGEPQQDTPGLTYRDGDRWVENPPRKFLRDLDSLPFPKWELFPYGEYKLPASSTRPEIPFLPMLTSRGCPINCQYCPYPVGQGTAWRYRSPENVVDEMERLVRDFGVRYIIFRDPMFSLLQKRVIALCDEIVARGLKMEWRCETRVDFLKEDTLRAMARAGCNGINFGIESSDMEIQKGVGRRPIGPEEFTQAVKLCNELGIKTFGFFIIGLPGDTLRTVLDSIRFAIDLNLNWVQFTASTPFVGTQLRDWAIAQGLVADDDYAYINSHQGIIGNDHLSASQVNSLLRLAQFLQKNFMNRRGLFKDLSRHSPAYRFVRRSCDWLGATAARGIHSAARLWYGRQLA